MKNIVLLVAVFISHYASAQYFQATINKDGNDLIFLIRANPAGPDIETNWSDTEFFVRWPNSASAFNFGAITVNTTDFPGVQIPNNGQDAQGTETGYRNNWFGTSFSATSPSIYVAGVEYELFRVSLDVPATTVDFELVHNEGFFPHYLALIDGAGNDLSNVTGNMFYGSNAMICSPNCPVSTPGVNHVDEGIDVALPVDFISFSAERQEKQVKLNWLTASEENNWGFYVERLNDQRDWNSIGFVEGRGTVEGINDYHFLDLRPRLGTNYYRLKQVDFDGSFEYSQVVSVEIISDESFQVFPNPTKGIVNILSPESGTVKVMDNLGRLLKKENIDANSNLDMSLFPSGIYFIQFNSETNLVSTLRLIKE